MNYNPLVKPDPELWLGMEETERIHQVLDFHKRAGISLPSERVHAVIHVTIENQAAMGDETPVARTLERLETEGLDRHDAIHAVGSVLAEHLWALMATDDGGPEDPESAYFRQVRELDAQRWLDEFGEG